MPIRLGIVFDFDGTLVDSFSPRPLAHHNVAGMMLTLLKPFGLVATGESVYAAVREAEESMNRAQEYSRPIWWRRVASELCVDHGEVPTHVWVELSECYWMTIADHSRVFPGVRETLATLKKSHYPLGLLTDTDGSPGIKARRIAASGLARYFDAVVIAGEGTAHVKPDPEPFRHVQALLGVTGATSVYVGDNPAVDIAGARRAGMHSVLVGSECSTSLGGQSADFLVKRNDFGGLVQIAANLMSSAGLLPPQ